MFNTRDNDELWFTYIAPANILLTIIAFIIFIFVIVLTLVGYTPILEALPGYSSESMKMRNEMIDNILRLDSMERVIENIMLYNHHVALIMSGEIPLKVEDIAHSTESYSKELVMPDLFDSVLRRDIETGGRYNLLSTTFTMMLTPMAVPAEGEIVNSFDIAEERYGIDISLASGERVLAVQHGVVTLALWSPSDGHIVQILHPDNMISIYQNIENVTVKRGDKVDAGGVIGYSGEMSGAKDDATKSIIRFELWEGDRPVDPQKYIVF